MNTLALNFNENQVRTVMDDNGEPLFNAKDVCECLGLKDVNKAVSKLDDEDKGTQTFRTPGGKQSMTVVNESGLYHLIFASYKDEAKQFKRWVTKEVLPSIRKTGGYSLLRGNDMLGFHKKHGKINPVSAFAIEFNNIKATAYYDRTHGFIISGKELGKLMEVSDKTIRVVKLHHKDIIKEDEAYIKLGQMTYWTQKGVDIISLHNRKGEFAKYVHSGELQLQTTQKISYLLSA